MNKVGALAVVFSSWSAVSRKITCQRSCWFSRQVKEFENFFHLADKKVCGPKEIEDGRTGGNVGKVFEFFPT